MKNNNIGKFISLLVVVFVISAFLSSCNQTVFDTNNQTVFDTKWHFDKAVMQLGAFAKTVRIESWTDFEDSDCVQFTDTDGNTYLTHYSNVILIQEGK